MEKAEEQAIEGERRGRDERKLNRHSCPIYRGLATAELQYKKRK